MSLTVSLWGQWSLSLEVPNFEGLPEMIFAPILETLLKKAFVDLTSFLTAKNPPRQFKLQGRKNVGPPLVSTLSVRHFIIKNRSLSLNFMYKTLRCQKINMPFVRTYGIDLFINQQASSNLISSSYEEAIIHETTEWLCSWRLVGLCIRKQMFLNFAHSQ